MYSINYRTRTGIKESFDGYYGRKTFYKINGYGKRIQNNFIEKIKSNGIYEKIKEFGTGIAESNIENEKDLAGWYLLTYGEYALEILEEQKQGRKNKNMILFCKINQTPITFRMLEKELLKCFSEIINV